MIAQIVVVLVALGVGFGLGRVKNSQKLAAVSAEIAKAEASVSTEVKLLVSKIKSVL